MVQNFKMVQDRTGVMQKRRDSVLEGFLERSNIGKKGCRKGGIQLSRVQDRRHARKEGYRK